MTSCHLVVSTMKKETRSEDVKRWQESFDREWPGRPLGRVGFEKTSLCKVRVQTFENSALKITLEEWSSSGVVLLPKGQLALSTDIFGCHSCWWCLVGSGQGFCSAFCYAQDGPKANGRPGPNVPCAHTENLLLREWL